MRYRYLGMIVGLLFSIPACADSNNEYLLNSIVLQLHAEQWVTTQTALVTVSVNAAVAAQGIEKIQSTVKQQLNQLSNKGEWHIVSFDRQQDKSGLESIHIVGQARLPQEDLANLRNNAKSISVPGETLTIDNVQFTPSDDELKQANNALRNNIYQQAKMEMDALNKIYPDQHYYLHNIDFTNAPAPMPMNAMYKMDAVAARPAPLSVGNKQELYANVIVASLTDQGRKAPPPPNL